ncbi:MAG TPA: FecR domain-containing protein [Clostridia bacterium]|nr:FecR domain-containing protein [Clostridia bacterium]
MKQMQRLVYGFVACGIALAMVTSLAAQPIEGAAKVVRIKGSARYTYGSSVWQPLKVGAVLKPGTVVQTSSDEGSYVDLVLGDGEGSVAVRPVAFSRSTPPPSAASSMAYQPKSEQNTIRIMENSVLGVDKLTSVQTGSDVVTDTQLDLKAGRIIGSAKKMTAASKYEIKLPNGVAGIRGTFFDISAEGVVRVVTGSVVVAYVGPDGTVVTQVVAGGQQFDARNGQLSPLAPEVLNSLRPIMPLGSSRPAEATTFSTPPNILYVSPIIGN